MSKDKINEALEEFGTRYGFVAKLNEDNICALTADDAEKVFVEYIPDADRVTVYANLFAYSEQTLSIEQLKLVMLMNIELFAKTGGIVALHPLNENPILCWGADADVLPKEALINVLLNIVELIKIVREKLDLYESTPSSEFAAPTPSAKVKIPELSDKTADVKAVKPAAKPAAKPTAGNLQDMLMKQIKK